MFYDVSFIVAATPEAKGKVERSTKSGKIGCRHTLPITSVHIFRIRRGKTGTSTRCVIIGTGVSAIVNWA